MLRRGVGTLGPLEAGKRRALENDGGTRGSLDGGGRSDDDGRDGDGCGCATRAGAGISLEGGERRRVGEALEGSACD